MDSHELLIMGVIIEFGTMKGAGVESYGMKVAVGSDYRQNSPEGIIRGIGLHDGGKSGIIMMKDRSGSESLLQFGEGFSTV
jgi:hypothetical protein